MAAVSAATGPNSFGHSSLPQDEYDGWDQGTNGHVENPLNGSLDDYENLDPPAAMSISHNGASSFDHSDNYTTPRESRSNSRAAPYPQTKRMQDGTFMTYDDENSKWIHRDKLAKIESEELQAAGIVLPKPRTQSRSRRDRSQDKASTRRRGTTDSADPQHLPRSRKNSDLGHDRAPDVEVPSWDLRLPEEIAEDPGEYWVSNESGKGTRIPRKQSNPLLDEEVSIAYPKTRSRSNSNANTLDDVSKAQLGKRSVTDGSPKKVGAPRKTSVPTKTTASGRPKTRSGTTPRSTSTTRPSTRSGEVSSPRAPEGEPPWMVSAYQPDPRLPPDQQLLPTVAKRLQQEKWEQEGTFGNIYDKEFRPLNESPLTKPPEPEKPPQPQPQQENEEQNHDEWPLKPEARVPTPSRPGTSSYSTMPKIQGKPAMSPLGGPRPIQQMHSQTAAAVMIPEPPVPEKQADKKSGCGCCLVM
ncbi:hypothetical protein F5Y17DRAFT_30327 [Xylariaceae sp. FL0594]|nr:hypothetical protein F5Y17DRAFT_30327 [Xylariaceae sp. FL0594]